MNKKFLSLVLALVMVLGTFTNVFAEEVKVEEVEVPKITENDKKIQWLQDTKIVEGRKFLKDGKEDTDLALDSNITRAEITKLLIYSLGKQDLATKVASVKIYTDVEAEHWANGFIIVGSTTPSPVNPVYMIVGYPDQSFKPENDVTYAELAKMLVVLVKKDLTKDMEKSATWPSSWLTWAAELGILEGVSYADANKAAPRKDAFVMLYNALYQLKTIKKTNANETLGIISGLTNGKLTLNQGEKAKTFNIVGGSTLLVQHDRLSDKLIESKDGRYFAYKVNAISNPEFYYGSLVRVLSDKDGNATHIIVLGNPLDLALGENVDEKGEKNVRWKGVADYTVETNDRLIAKVTFDDGDVDRLQFVERANNNNVVVNLRVNDKTQYFVADATKNQLTKVDSLAQAVQIVGYREINDTIDAVYAGFDTEGGANHWETSKYAPLSKYAEAKVVVFNKVAKDNASEGTYRVRIDTDSRYDAVLENTKGEVKIDSARFNNVFPYNFDADKFDVIKITNHPYEGRNYVRLIDHSDTEKFPIVRVRTIDGRKLVVEGAYGETARLVLASDVKIFTDGQLKEGSLIQFRTDAGNTLVGQNDANKTNVLTHVSVLPDVYDINIKGVQGSLKQVVEGNQDNQVAGSISSLWDRGNGDYEVTVDLKRDLYDDAAYEQRVTRTVVKGEAEALNKVYELIKGVEAGNPGYVSPFDNLVRFKTQPGRDAEIRAYDFEVYNRVEGRWYTIQDAIR